MYFNVVMSISKAHCYMKFECYVVTPDSDVGPRAEKVK